MQESISANVMNGNTANLLILAAVVVFVVLSFILCLKSGLVVVGTKKIKAGLSGDSTRDLIRQQFDYAQNAIQMFVSAMPAKDGFDEYKARYASELVLDEVNRWIVFNHIRDDEFYVSNKQVIVWNILQKLGQKEEYRTEEFRKSVYETVERIIKQLVRIKIYYEREEA